MSGKGSRPDHAAKLRRQAEEIVQDNAASPKHFEALSPEETLYMLHELQVHQIELEMQNEELRQAQVKLDAGRARYFDLYDLAPVGCVTITEQGLLLEANLTTTTLLGVTRNELIKQPFSRFVLREDQDVYYFLHKQLFETGESHGCELRMVKKDGTAFWVRLQASSVQDTAGPAISRVVISDITERKRAETSLQETKKMAETYLNVAADVIITLDAQGIITLLNDSGHRLLGYAPGELIGRNWFDTCLPEEARTEVHGVFAKLMDGQDADVQRYESSVITRNGNRLDLLWHNTLLREANGRIVGTLSSAQDITDRKRAEEALRESEERYRTLIQNLGVGIGFVDPEEQFSLANAAAEEIFGVPPGGLLGRSLREFTSPEQLAIILEQTDRRRAGEKSVYEIEISRPGGEKRNLLVTAVPQFDGQERFLGTHGVFHDITDRKQAETQLRQSQKMEAIGELAGGIAHDFNNLLTGMLGNIAIIRGDLPASDPLLENLNAAESGARQAANLTKGLLTFSRSAVVLPVPTKTADALDATLVLLKQSLPATITIVRDYEQAAWNVLVDQSQMTQILLNLAVNARDAMEGKGALTIRARNEVVGEEYLQTHPFARTGEFVHLSVTDTGPGMSSEVMHHLFEPFYTTKPIGSGTGIGLSVVYGAVRQAGGWITAVSTEGVGENTPQIGRTSSGKPTPHIGQTCSGATFDIYLPRCLEEPIQSFAPSPLPVNLGSGTVLVIEDEPVVRTVTQALLSRSGYTVLTAPDGASALNVLQDHPLGIGLILLDMTMPGLTTGEIVQVIQALDPMVPILLTSGYASNDTVKRMLAEGTVQGFLPKPYELHELVSTINQLLQRA